MPMLEARCERCRETFNPDDEEDLIHVQRDDGTECGGEGVITGEWHPDLPKPWPTPPVMLHSHLQLWEELTTDPDMAEMADELAEQLRSSLYENDDLEERVYDVVTSLMPPIDDMPTLPDDVLSLAQKALIHLLFPRIMRVLTEGDWVKR